MTNPEFPTTLSETSFAENSVKLSQPEIIAPPPGLDIPDKATKTAPDFTGDQADGRVFHFNKWGIKYGVDDKSYAASIILAVFTGVLFALVVLVGIAVERSWTGDAIKILGTAFTFISGVAIGKGSKD